MYKFHICEIIDFSLVRIYMLFAGWGVRTVTGSSIFKPEVTVFHYIQTDLEPQITCLFLFPAVKLAYWFYRYQMGLFTQLLSFSQQA